MSFSQLFAPGTHAPHSGPSGSSLMEEEAVRFCLFAEGAGESSARESVLRSSFRDFVDRFLLRAVSDSG